MKHKIAFTVVLVFVFACIGVSYAADVSYTADIKPVFDKHCSSCHGQDSPSYKEFKRDKEGYTAKGLGPRMHDYTYMLYFIGWPDTGALMRRLDDGTGSSEGKPGNMYNYLGDTDKERQDNLNLFRQWIGTWTLKRLNEITIEELRGIKVPY